MGLFGGIGNLLFGKPKTASTAPMQQATDKAVALQNKTYDEAKGYTQPYYDTGVAAQNRIGELLGLTGDPNAAGYGSMTQPFDFQADPSYQFRLAEGNKALNRSMAARGKYYDPEAVKALEGYGQDLASQEYQNAYARDMATKQNLFNTLAGTAGAGETAYRTMIPTGSAYATNVGNLYTGMGNANVAAQQARINAQTSQNNAVAGMFGDIFSDKRLKNSIKKVGEKDGVNIYQFKYNNNPDKIFEGVMAQEVQKDYPNSVMKDSEGYLSVDYSQLPVDFREVV